MDPSSSLQRSRSSRYPEPKSGYFVRFCPFRVIASTHPATEAGLSATAPGLFLLLSQRRW